MRLVPASDKTGWPRLAVWPPPKAIKPHFRAPDLSGLQGTPRACRVAGVASSYSDGPRTYGLFSQLPSGAEPIREVAGSVRDEGSRKGIVADPGGRRSVGISCPARFFTSAPHCRSDAQAATSRGRRRSVGTRTRSREKIATSWRNGQDLAGPKRRKERLASYVGPPP